MRERHLHITNGNLITREMLMAYISNELNETDRRRIERQLAEDPFLSDAVEGLKNIDKHKANSALDKIYRDIDIITGAKKPFTISRSVKMYAVAATMILFLGLTFIIMSRLNETQEQPDIALNQNAETEVEHDTYSPEFYRNSDMGGGDTESDTAVTISNNLIGEATIIYKDEVIAGNAIVVEQEENQETEVLALRADELTETKTTNDFGIQYDDKTTEDIAVIPADGDVVNFREELDAPFTTANVASSKETSEYRPVMKSMEVDSEKRSKKIKKDKNDKDEVAAGAAESVSSQLYETVDTASSLYSFPEVMPTFPGGQDSLNAFIARTIHYPTISYENKNISDPIVYIQFVINEDGSISNAEVIRGVSPAFDLEALNVVAQMPAWIPGKQNGVAVKTKYVLVVKFG